MDRTRVRLIIAAGLALVGMVLAWRALRPGGVGHAAALPIPLSVPVTEMLADKRFEIAPTPENADVVAAQAGARAKGLARALAGGVVPSGKRADDLAAVVSERIHLIITGDYARRRTSMAARGHTESADAAAEFEPMWQASAEATRLSPLSLERMEVRAIYAKGVLLTSAETEKGFGTSTTSLAPGQFPIASDAVAGKLDVVEVRLPIKKKTIRGEMSTVLVGFQFAWSVKRQQWLPWRIVIYMNPNEAHGAILW